MRLTTMARVLAALTLMGLVAGCVPAVEVVEGAQRVVLTTTGRRQWTVDSVVASPGFTLGVADDGLLATATGRHTVTRTDGQHVELAVDVSRIGDRLLGTVEVTEVASGKQVVGIVDEPAPPVRNGSVRIEGTTGSVYAGRLYPGRVQLDLSPSGGEGPGDPGDPSGPPGAVVLGRSVPVGAIDPPDSREWTYDSERAETLDVHVSGGACPDISVLDPTAAEIAVLSGCGDLTIDLPSGGRYRFRATADVALPTGARFVVTAPLVVGDLARDERARVPELQPGQRAVFTTVGELGEWLNAAAWSPSSQTTVDLLEPDGGLLATSSQVARNRFASALLHAGGAYQVVVRNAGDDPATDVDVRATALAVLGELDQHAVAPELQPGGSAGWTRPASVGERVVFTAHTADPDTCFVLGVAEPGDQLPVQHHGCGSIAVPMTASTDGVWQVQIANSGTSTIADGVIEVGAGAPVPADPLEVGKSASVGPLAAGISVDVPLVGAGGGLVWIAADAPEGACPSLALRRAGSIVQEAADCQESLGRTVLEAPIADGDVIEVTSGSGSETPGAIALSARAVVHRPQGTLASGVPVPVPPLDGATGEEAVWDLGTDGPVALSVGVHGVDGVCVDIEVDDGHGSIHPYGEQCGSNQAPVIVVATTGAQLRVRPSGPTSVAADSTTVSVAPPDEPAAVTTPAAGALRVAPANAVAAASLQSPNTEAADQPCRKVLFVGLRGSGQTSGHGPEVWTAFQEIQRSIEGRLGGPDQLGQIAIEMPDYDALPVPFPDKQTIALGATPGLGGLAAARWFGQARGYLDGLAKGSDALYDLLQRRRHCGAESGELLILSGYSQGAMAVHRTLLDLAANHQDDILTRVSGAVLVADGDRHRQDGMVTYGSAGRLLQGVARTYQALGGARSARFADADSNRIRSVCFARDFVCDHFLFALEGAFTHTKYANTQPVRDAARDAATRALVQYRNAHGWPGDGGGSLMTFDEVQLGTTVTDQYSSSGVVFTSQVFTTGDGSNPTSPVLSGSPTFEGPIVGRLTGGGRTPISSDVGYINNPGSVVLIGYDSGGRQVESTSARSLGINRLTLTNPAIRSFEVRAIGTEDAGFAIDNLSIAGVAAISVPLLRLHAPDPGGSPATARPPSSG